jgi:superfamily II DNA or RNA helicase
MESNILSNLVRVPGMGRAEMYDPTVGFWELWRRNRGDIRKLRFHPRKHGSQWYVHRDGGELANPVPETSGPASADESESESEAMPYEYQCGSIEHLVGVLRERKSGIDASDTGAGKTYIAAFVCRKLGLRPIVVCLKSAVGSWKRALLSVGYRDEEMYVNNYEQYVRGNCFKLYDGARFHGGEEHLVIVDEVHRCKNRRTKNARLLGRIAASRAYVLLLSATAIESPDKCGPIVSALGLCEPGWVGERRWMSAHGCRSGRFGRNPVFCGGKEHLIKMHGEIFPDHGVRLRIRDIPNFPACRHIVDPVTLEDSERRKVEVALENVRSLTEQLRAVGAGSVSPCSCYGNIGEIQKERQVVEACKLPLIGDMVEDLVDELKSVAVFINFRSSMEYFKKRYGARAAYVYGQQSTLERDRAVELFQSDRVHIIVLNSEAGGTSISLHDERGMRPRYSIVSPSWSAVTFKQVLGRIHRMGGRSAAIQRIVLVDGTIESHIAARLRKKLENITHINDAELNDGDLI